MRNCVLYALEGEIKIKTLPSHDFFGTRIIYSRHLCLPVPHFDSYIVSLPCAQTNAQQLQAFSFRVEVVPVSRFPYIIQDAFVVDNDDDDAFYSKATRLKVIPYHSNIAQRRNHELC